MKGGRNRTFADEVILNTNESRKVYGDRWNLRTERAAVAPVGDVGVPPHQIPH